MAMTRATNMPLKRVASLLDYVETKLEKEGSDTIEIWEDDIQNIPLLESKEALRVAAETIDGNADIHARTEVIERMMRTGLPEPKSQQVKIWACTIHIGDWGKLLNYKREIQKELEDAESTACLIFDREKGIFYEKEQGPSIYYAPQKGNIPYKLLNLLIEHTGPLSAQEIADTFNFTSSSRAHKEVDNLKNTLASKLQVSKEAFIVRSNQDVGYELRQCEVI